MLEKIINFDEPLQRASIAREIQSLRGLQRVTICRAAPRRSDRQNRYYWPCFVGSLFDYCVAQGDEITRDEVHELFKAKFLRRTIVNKSTGEIIGQAIASTTDLTTVEFNEYLDKCARFLSEMGIIVPEPDAYRESVAA